MKEGLVKICEMVKEGCCVFWFDLEGDKVSMPVWRGRGSVNILVCKLEKEALIQRMKNLKSRGRIVEIC